MPGNKSSCQGKLLVSRQAIRCGGVLKTQARPAQAGTIHAPQGARDKLKSRYLGSCLANERSEGATQSFSDSAVDLAVLEGDRFRLIDAPNPAGNMRSIHGHRTMRNFAQYHPVLKCPTLVPANWPNQKTWSILTPCWRLIGRGIPKA